MKKFFYFFLGLIAAWGIVQLIPPRGSKKTSSFSRLSLNKPLIVAHGGAKQLFPENTLHAFRECLKYDVDVFEMDVCLTKDHQLVLHHDLTLDRTTDGTGLVSNYRMEELRELNFGYKFTDLQGNRPYENRKIPPVSLEEMFQEFPDVPMLVELKNKGELGQRAAEIIHQLITKYDRQDQVAVCSFYDETINDFKDLDGGQTETSMGQSEATKFVLAHKLGLGNIVKTDATTLQLPLEASFLDLHTQSFIDKMAKKGMALYYWTINDPEEMQMLIDRNVDGIITDRPDLLQQLLNPDESPSN